MRTSNRFALSLAAAAVFLGSSTASAVILFDNGPLATGAVTRSGVAAPAGSVWSELALGNTSAGASVHPNNVFGAFRGADDFVLAADSTLTSITSFAYVTGSTDAQVFTTGNVRIWNGRPGDPGASVVFGDTTTDRVSSGALTNMFRVFGTTAAPGGTPSAPGTTRRIKTAVFDTPVALSAGTYWFDFQIVSPVTPTGAVFYPAVTFPNDRTKIDANGRQFVNDPPATPTGAIWADSLDTGNPATLPDVLLDYAFFVEGTVVPEPTSALMLGTLGLGLLRRSRRNAR